MNLTPQQYAKRLKRLAKDELPGVYARSLNIVATAADDAQRQSLRASFRIRNKWTEGSLAMWKSRPNKQTSQINAVVGSRSDYLRTQEEGGIETSQDGRPTMSMPSRKSRRGNWGKPVSAAWRPAKFGNVARRGRGGAMSPTDAKFFILGPGSSEDGLNHRKITKAWGRYQKTLRAGGKPRKIPPKHQKYRLTEEAIFTRTGTGRLVRVRVLNKGVTRLKATHWHSRAIDRVATEASMNAAFVAEASAVLTRLGAT